MFGGENSEQQNALMSAVMKGAETEIGGKVLEVDSLNDTRIYEFLDLPKTSLIVELVDALNKIGYKIIKT